VRVIDKEIWWIYNYYKDNCNKGTKEDKTLNNCRKQNGITLVTLAITIIVLIILAIITTSELQKEGIFGQANNLKGDFDELQSGYNQILDELENEVRNDFTHNGDGEHVECIEHVLNDGVITIAATCYSSGEKVYTCINPGCTYTETIELFPLTHDYEYKNTSDTYLNTAATCLTPAVYHYSCSKCGTRWETTFLYGTPLGHSFTNKEASETYLKTPATCTSQAIYYCSCIRCGEKGENTFGTGNALGHSHTAEDTSEKYLKKAATCTTQAVYYYSCVRCGQASTSKTFTTGSVLGHNYIKDISSTYLKTAATCEEAAVYYYRCNSCNQKSEDTFTYGSALGHSYTSGKCSVCGKCQQLEQYIHYETDPNVTYFNCEICGKTWTEDSNSWDGEIVHP